MKNILCFVFMMFSVFAFADCSSLYSAVTYAFSHSGKSLKANNFDHQRYYAKRSMEAIEKAEEQLGSCGCTKAGNIIYDIKENLEKAMDPEDWDMGRFYVKKARTFIDELITTLDLCTADTDPVPATVPDTAKEDDYKDKKVRGEDTATLAEKQMALKKEQEALITRQKELERQLKEQRLLEQRLKEERELELDTQKELMVKAEIELYKMESAAVELIRTFSCEKEFSAAGAYKRNEEVLENESLKETRDFYKEKFREIAGKMLKELNACTNK
ncbi:hypothetical protein [Sinomicrobium sp. M5D2P17]